MAKTIRCNSLLDKVAAGAGREGIGRLLPNGMERVGRVTDFIAVFMMFLAVDAAQIRLKSCCADART